MLGLELSEKQKCCGLVDDSNRVFPEIRRSSVLSQDMLQIENKLVMVNGADDNVLKTCPSQASHHNIPENLDQTLIHTYGSNFNLKIYGLPVPIRGQVLGLIGSDSSGKGEIYNILSGRSIPNFGRVHNPPDWQEVLTYFKGSGLYDYFTLIGIDKAKVLKTPDHFTHVPIGAGGTVRKILDQIDERGMKAILCSDLELNHVMDHNLADLSIGELQRFAIAAVALQDAEVYMFDEPSNFLDVKQRLKAAQVILSLSLSKPDSYVMVADHDTSVLDYISDFVCCLYRLRNSCQVVTLPFSVREGINIYLDGFVPNSNIRFRKESLTFEVTETLEVNPEEELQPSAGFKYPSMSIIRDGFKLTVNEGEFTDSHIIVILGENGTGKSTFIKMLAGRLNPDTVGGEIPPFRVSYKPQYLKAKCKHYTVRAFLNAQISDACRDPQFRSDVMEPLGIMELMNLMVWKLSAIELNRVALCLCLGKPADIYLIDEPTARMDSEDIIIAAKLIKRFMHRTKKVAFVADHNLMLATYLADKVIVFEGIPSIDCTANSPASLFKGINRFSSHLDISFKRDPINIRPVINKLNSDCDTKQKAAGLYYLKG